MNQQYFLKLFYTHSAIVMEGNPIMYTKNIIKCVKLGLELARTC